MTRKSPDIRHGRLSTQQLDDNFSDLHPPLSRPEALIAADRCYFCYDAPCTTACPTGIDIPAFIQKIRSDNLHGSAKTILSENIMGGMCARVCPTEVLCEQACVRNTHEDKPIDIGLLQRYATDPVFKDRTPMFSRAAQTGKRVAVVGGGPAGLSCAHRLAVLGHDVVVFNRDTQLGGLNEYGIAAYKTVDNFAQREIDYILSIGGIEIRNNTALGENVELAALREEYDAVFLGLGLAGTNTLGIENDDLPGVVNAIEYISELRQTNDKSVLPVGRNVIVIGGGMTAIDIAVQSKKLGAEQVNIVYRRGPDQMSASRFEQDLAQTNGVTIHHWAQPARLIGKHHVAAVDFVRTEPNEDGHLTASGEEFRLDADIVFKAIGQILDGHSVDDTTELKIVNGKISVDEHQQTSLEDVWAGGDCVLGGDDLTVSAVQHGKVAAIAIDQYLRP